MSDSQSTSCCIVGGGPAGVFLGYLLARSGVDVVVLEKHADFLLDFRGDTIHPSTMQLLHELGILDDLLPLVELRAERLRVQINGRTYIGPDFSHLATICPYIGLVPQWDFLNLISRHARQFPGFDLRMKARATGVVREQGRVVGVTCEGDSGSYEVRADLVVAADGRSSTIRAETDHVVEEQGIPIDVLWFRLDRPEGDDGQTLAWLKDGRMLVTLPRRDHYQTAMVIQKGAFEQIRAEGIERFRDIVGEVCPPLTKVVRRLESWDDVKLLTVQINRLVKWHEPGLLFIGDAAHAMSPVGGVGINLAIQDAVAAANRLVEPLKSGTPADDVLASIQQHREPAARKTQRLQSIIHSNLFGRGTAPGKPFSPPWYLRLLAVPLMPLLRRMAGK